MNDGRILANPKNDRFIQLLNEMLETHDSKDSDYAGEERYSNIISGAKDVGLKPSEAVFVRMGDKFSRLRNLIQKERNMRVMESLKETAMDLAVYCVIYSELWEMEEEERKKFDRAVQEEKEYEHNHRIMEQFRKEGWVPPGKMSVTPRKGHTGTEGPEGTDVQSSGSGGLSPGIAKMTSDHHSEAVPGSGDDDDVVLEVYKEADEKLRPKSSGIDR